MATVTTFVDNVPTVKLLNDNMVKAEQTIDFSVTNVSAADVVQVLNIPKAALVTKAGCNVAVAEGATATATFGDATTADGWDASVNLNSTGNYISTEGTDTYGAGKVYTAADTLDLTVSADLDAGKVYVYAIYCIIEGLQ